MLTVEQFIEKLKTLDQKAEVLIEVNHDELIAIKDASRIEEEDVSLSYGRVTRGDEVKRKKVVLVRAN